MLLTSFCLESHESGVDLHPSIAAMLREYFRTARGKDAANFEFHLLARTGDIDGLRTVVGSVVDRDFG